MSTDDTSWQEMERSLMELGRDIVYPIAPDVTSRVRARIVATRPTMTPRVSVGRVGIYGTVAAVIVLASVLAISPSARATLMPWWSAGSMCPGQIAGQPLKLTEVTSSEFCDSGIVLTRPIQQANVSKADAVETVKRAERYLQHFVVYEVALAVVHKQTSTPARSWFAWVVVTALNPVSRHPLYPEADIFLVNAKSGRLINPEPRRLAQLNGTTRKRRRGVVFPLFVAAPPSHYEYSGIQFPTQRDGFVLGTRTTSVLFVTEDAGRSWSKRSIPNGQSDWFQFVNGSVGWLESGPPCRCNHPPTYLYRTTDGGVSWRRIFSIGKQGAYQTEFVSTAQGWLQYSGNYAPTLETADGGHIWHRVHWPFSSYHQWHFTNARLGWASVSGHMFTTADGGRIWVPRAGLSGVYNLPSFANAVDGWTVSVGLGVPGGCEPDSSCPSALLRTRDGGRTWSVEHSAAEDSSAGYPPHGRYWPGGWSYYLDQPQFVDARHGWMIFGGWNSRASPPGGANWYLNGGVTTTSDGGKTWHMHRLNLPASAEASLATVSGKQAWLAVENLGRAEKSFILHTVDEGRHWEPIIVAQ
jgi:photosystem II stability/assembly factor-like uncharacterized protein